MTELRKLIETRKVEIGVVAVPDAAAQSVANALTTSGVKGILNLTLAHVHAPPDIPVTDLWIVAHLQELVYLVRSRGLPAPFFFPRETLARCPIT